MATIIQLWYSGTAAYSTTADSSATFFMFAEYSDTYSFSVSGPTTGGYQVAVTAFDSTKYGITVASPQSGGSLVMGQIDTIRWSGKVTPGGNVDIYLGNDSGRVGDIGTAAAAVGSYAWTVPSTLSPGNRYYIEIVSRFTSRIYGSSGKFAIRKID